MLPALGIQPAIGRHIADAEDQEGAQGSVVLSHALWSQRFGGDRSVIGNILYIDDQPHTVVGVMPEGVSFPSRETMYWKSMAHANRGPTTWYLRVVGRVHDGLSVEQARAGLALIELWDPSVGEDDPPERVPLDVIPLHEYTVGSLDEVLMLFQGAVIAVLLIAALNVMNLVLSRTADRQREITVRAALGASKGRLVRLALTETTMLGLVGGAVGIALSYALLKLVLATAPEAVPLQEQVGIDLPVVATALGASLGVGFLIGLVPALRACGISLRNGLQDGARGYTGGVNRQRLRKSLVAAQIGLALVLLVGGGLLLRSFVSLWNVDPGFEPDRVLGVSIALSDGAYPGKDPKRAFYEELFPRLVALPGVQSAAAGSSFPFTGAYSTSRLEIEDYEQGDEEGIRSEFNVVTPGYFETLGIPFITGRDFDDREATDSRAIIVSKSFADAYFPDGAIGRRVRGIYLIDDWLTIIGVVGNIQHRGLDVPAAHQTYVSYTHYPLTWAMSVTMRADGSVQDLAGSVHEIVASLDDDIPVPYTFPLTRLMEDSVRQERFMAGLSIVFAATAVLLAVVGVYGVVAYGVSNRTRELGIRIALGAEANRVTRDVVLDASIMTGIGLLFGLAGAFAVSGALQNLLFNLDARDPLVFGIAAASLIMAAVAASYLPARRAGHVDPIEALRSE
jgi:putative ABC transport system permease protein